MPRLSPPAQAPASAGLRALLLPEALCWTLAGPGKQARRSSLGSDGENLDQRMVAGGQQQSPSAAALSLGARLGVWAVISDSRQLCEDGIPSTFLTANSSAIAKLGCELCLHFSPLPEHGAPITGRGLPGTPMSLALRPQTALVLCLSSRLVSSPHPGVGDNPGVWRHYTD